MDKKFLLFAESLKLVRKAGIELDNINIINDVYTDLLSNNGIINKFNLPNTSILVGRKGTGKSTVIQKSLYDISNDESIIGLYIDVKTIYDNATPVLYSQDDSIIIEKELIKYFIYKNFLHEIIRETKTAFSNTLKGKGFIKKMYSYLSMDVERVENKLDEIEKSIDNVYKNIDTSLVKTVKNMYENYFDDEINASAQVSLNSNVNIGISREKHKKIKADFETTLIKYLDIKKCIIDNFLEIRDILKVKYLYIYLDDYSEIDKSAQKLFMDWLIAPLNNYSDDFIKFKIAAYPGRLYVGKMDNQKFDMINLDFYGALSSYRNIAIMEKMAINYTKRLIQNRFKIFLPEKQVSDYFSVEENDLYELLFDVSLNIPRKLGHILSFCYESSISCGKRIGKTCIYNAALRYYDEIISLYFESNKYVVRDFDDKVAIEIQKELMDKIIQKQIDNKTSIRKSSAKLFMFDNPPTSHFLIDNEISHFLNTLELNGYISTYNKMNDKFNNPSTLYAIDYGLCKKYSLNFGRPKDSKLRKYYNEYKFIFNDLVKEHFSTVQIIVCENGHEFNISNLKKIEEFNWTCPKCIRNNIFSKCKVVSPEKLCEKVSQYKLNGIELQDNIEYELLDFLYKKGSKNSFSAVEISKELDYNWQLISKRAGLLITKHLVCLDEEKKDEKRYYKICESTEMVMKAQKKQD